MVFLRWDPSVKDAGVQVGGRWHRIVGLGAKNWGCGRIENVNSTRSCLRTAAAPRRFQHLHRFAALWCLFRAYVRSTCGMRRCAIGAEVCWRRVVRLAGRYGDEVVGHA